MSWSVAAQGDSVKVAAEIESQFLSSGAQDAPEEAIKQSARALIAQALAGNEPSRFLTVSAWGRQTKTPGVPPATDEVTNSLHINIT